MARRISIINFKGGVGKTTLAFHLCAFLAREHKVLAIDVDHQSSLSIVMLGKLWEARVTSGLTANRIFQSFCNPRQVKMPGKDIIFANPIHARQPRWNLYPNLDLVSAQFELDDTEIDLASTTMGSPPVSEWEKRTLLASWIDSVDADSTYDYIVFDCPPATKLVSQNALAASNYFVIPVIPDELSSRGVTHFRNLVTEKVNKKLEFLRTAAGISPSDAPKAYVPQTKMAGIAAFMAKTAGRAASGMTNLHTQQLRTLRRRWKDDLMQSVVKHLTGIPESIDAGWPVWDLVGEKTNVTGQVVSMMESVCQEIKDRVS